MLVEFLDINLLNVLLVVPDDIQALLVFAAPIPVFIEARRIGWAVNASSPGHSVLRINFDLPGDYEYLAYVYPQCETEPVSQPPEQVRYTVTKIVYEPAPSEIDLRV